MVQLAPKFTLQSLFSVSPFVFIVLRGTTFRFSNQFGIVSETHFSCEAVGRELWLAILNSLLSPETDSNIRIGKRGCVLPSDISFLTSISVSTVVLTLGKVEFFK